VFKTLAAIAAVLALTAIDPAPAAAQANRTFVSGHGSDSNPCSLAAPCRSFAEAVTQTNPEGEIVVLDSAGYGAVTIDRAVSISNPDGVEAGVTVTSGDGITIAAGADDVVNLRGLTVLGGGVGTNGITFASGFLLKIDKCEIRGFTAGGINVQNSNSVRMTVTDTTVSNNLHGVYIGGDASSWVTLSRLHSTGNGATGVTVNPVSGIVPGLIPGAASVTVGDSLLDHNGTGVFLHATGVGLEGTLVYVNVDNSKIVGSTGMYSVSANGAGSTVILGRTLIDSPQFVGTGARFKSWGNNEGFDVHGNPAIF
jgi:hypothetical protein